MGAVVRVNHTDGAFTIQGKFALPSSSIGCPMNEDVNYFSDVRHRDVAAALSRGRATHLSWGTDWGRLSVVGLDGGKVVHTKEGRSSDLSLFDGFTSFALADEVAADRYVGLTPHVTEDGFCSDGCFRLGAQAIASGVFTGLPALPFKSVMTDARFLDAEAGVYYAQGSYPLDASARCSADDTAECLFAIDAKTGKLLSSKPMPTFTVYKYEDALDGVAADGTVLAWGFGFQETCGKDLNSFAFARVHLANATASLLGCIPKKDVVHFNPAMGGFSHDNSRFATASGNPEVGEMQLLVFDASKGATTLNTDLKGLPRALGASADAPFVAVWGLAHMPPAA